VHLQMQLLCTFSGICVFKDEGNTMVQHGMHVGLGYLIIYIYSISLGVCSGMAYDRDYYRYCVDVHI
jgi:hypothetical protein